MAIEPDMQPLLDALGVRTDALATSNADLAKRLAALESGGGIATRSGFSIVFQRF